MICNIFLFTDRSKGLHLKFLSIIKLFTTIAVLLIAFPINAQIEDQQKIDRAIKSVLFTIEARGITRENARARNISQLSNFRTRIDIDGRIHIYIHMFASGASELSVLQEHEVEIEIDNKNLAVIQGWVPFDRLEEIATLSFIKKITLPNYGIPRVGSVTTEGDSILMADKLRQLGLDGSGVKVGVISDGANDFIDAQNSGDLPDITMFGTCTPRPFDGPVCDPGATCNEGTAILEIIHDIAPGAQLAVAAGGTSLQFIQRVDELVNDFGADVVVDDLGYFAEPYFADGLIAQAVADVTEQVIYISSAGNTGLGHYEADYVSTSFLGSDVHNFGVVAAGASDTSLNVLIAPGRFLVTFLQWADPFGESANDYDLFLFNDAENNVLCPSCGSILAQSGSEDPIEAICYFNDTSDVVRGKIIIEKFAGISKRMEMYMLGGGGIFVEEYNMPEGSIFGHPAVTDVLAVGAINAADPGNDNIELFSSRGPARIEFPFLEIREKPDITAIDGVSVTGTGGFPSVFFGTSASAPHIAGIVALIKHALPDASPQTIRAGLKNSAVDLGAQGFDSIFGSGRVDSLMAFMEIAPDTDDDSIVDIFDNCPTDSNSNQLDYDSDQAGDACDNDDDNDEVLDDIDAFPLNAKETVDTDSDGIGDNYENANGLDLQDAGDANLDNDSDGLTNLEEFLADRNAAVNEEAVILLLNSSLDE